MISEAQPRHHELKDVSAVMRLTFPHSDSRSNNHHV